ncbi:diaminopimelate decarboxylase [Candidatus Endomicrobiellum devescovinae]|jgi:diaminopimelate decarboxylase|uniref:diaminopimelate decarboxylase n=1 Tax=Candidatus Endomicrobiellum devescovinae TaxID=3242322 RepID=UPI00283071BF|nr:diaminopimelate decarboxylase [Endomicrobium sp.]
MLEFRKGDLYIENVKLSDIAKEYGTSTYVYSKQQIVNNFENYKKAMALRDGLICFACKTNSSGAILKILVSLGAGADTTSGGEIYRCLKAGFNPSKIVYAGVGKTAEEIEYALKSKIFMLNVESFEELDVIDKIAGKLKIKANIAFRINPYVNPDTHSYIVTGKKGTKFGIPYEDAVKAYLTAKKKKNISVVGIHSHIGSQILEVEPFVVAAKRIKKIVDKVERHGMRISYIDCGGGLGIKYEKGEKVPSPKRLMSEIFSVFDKDKKFIVEPGRSIIGDAGHLLAKVLYRKMSGGKSFLITDAGMNDLIRPTLYDAYHEIVPVKKTNAKKVRSDVVGPICESGDFMGKDRMLPIVEQGEYLLVTCAGAYGTAMSSEYNSRPSLAEVLVDGKQTKLIRKRASYKDLMLNEIL